MDSNTTIQAGLLTTDNLAIYGAIVATFALIVSALQYISSVKDKQVRLKVQYKKHNNYKENIKNMDVINDDPLFPKKTSGEAYSVSIHNIGNINVYIKEVYGIALDEKRYDALIKQGNLLLKIESIATKEFIEPKSSKDYSLYFNKESKSFELKHCFVVDGNDKVWKAKLKRDK